MNTIIMEKNMKENLIKKEDNILEMEKGMNYLYDQLHDKFYKSEDISFPSVRLKELVGLPAEAEAGEAVSKFRQRFLESGMELDKKDEKNKLRVWLDDRKNPQGRHQEDSHIFFMKICFAFQMDVDQAENFIAKTFFDRAFYKSIHDISAYFCLNNHMSYSEFESIRKRNEEICKEHDNYEKAAATIATNILYEELKKISDIHDLEDYVYKYSSLLNEQGQMGAAINEIEELLRKVTAIADRTAKEWGEEGDTDNNVEKIVSIERYDEADAKRPAEYNKYLLMNFPSKDSVSSIIRERKGTYDSIRKTLILLHFFVFFFDKGNSAESTGELQLFDEYRFNADYLLSKCNFPKLWVGNPYEKLFLFCACHKDPINMFRKFVSDMYGVSKNERDRSIELWPTNKNINIQLALTFIYKFNPKNLKSRLEATETNL